MVPARFAGSWSLSAFCWSASRVICVICVTLRTWPSSMRLMSSSGSCRRLSSGLSGSMTAAMLRVTCHRLVVILGPAFVPAPPGGPPSVRRVDPPPALAQRRPQAELGAAPRRGDPGSHGPQRPPPLLRPQDQPGQDPPRGDALPQTRRQRRVWRVMLADEQRPSCPDTVAIKLLDKTQRHPGIPGVVGVCWVRRLCG